MVGLGKWLTWDQSAISELRSRIPGFASGWSKFGIHKPTTEIPHHSKVSDGVISFDLMPAVESRIGCIDNGRKVTDSVKILPLGSRTLLAESIWHVAIRNAKVKLYTRDE